MNYNNLEEKILEKDFIIASLEEKIKELESEKNKLNNQYVLILDELNNQKEVSNRYIEWYETIANSTTWRLTKPLRKIIDSRK